MPGGIDPHTHLEMPFMGDVTCDDFFTGHCAALAGGTTLHVDFALPVDNDLYAGYLEWRSKSKKAAMDYCFHMAVTGWNDKVPQDMKRLTEEEGINSYKFFMAYKGALMVSDEELSAGMQQCKEIGAIPMVHAENGDLVAMGQEKMFNMGITGPEGHNLSRPPELEAEATNRAIMMAQFLNVPLCTWGGSQALPCERSALWAPRELTRPRPCFPPVRPPSWVGSPPNSGLCRVRVCGGGVCAATRRCGSRDEQDGDGGSRARA